MHDSVKNALHILMVGQLAYQVKCNDGELMHDGVKKHAINVDG